MSRASDPIDRLLERRSETTQRLQIVICEKAKRRAYLDWLEQEARAIDRMYPPDTEPD